MTAPRSIAIVDDDEAVRESTAALLSAAAFEVDLYDSGDAFLKTDLNSINCVLLDIRMPGTDGIEVLRQLGEMERYPPVVVLTGHGDVALAVEAMKLGAMDFLEKPYEPTLLLNTLNLSIRNRQSGHEKVQPSKEALALIGRLSPRQREVLRRMLGGDPNKMMAWKLGLSIRTVEAHRAQMMARLQVRSISEVIQIGLAAGLTSLDRTGPPPR